MNQNALIPRFVKLGVGVFILGILAAGTFYTVPEGHVAVVKKFSKAVRMEDPGFHAKAPFIEGVETFEVRERKNPAELKAATKDRLPATAKVSMNWTVNKDAAMDLFIKYGGLDQFENRVLDPRMETAAKAAISRFGADVTIRDRLRVTSEIFQVIKEETKDLPITISYVNLQDITLPPTYMQSILEKEKAREDAERENHRLAQQKLVAQRLVQTANAERDANKAKADGNAYRTLTEAKAEAEAIKLINQELAKSPTYVDLVRAKAWDGVLPKTMLGETGGTFLTLNPTTNK